MSLIEPVDTARADGKIIYTAKTMTFAGRERGASRSSDGNLEVKLSMPGSRGGRARIRSNCSLPVGRPVTAAPSASPPETGKSRYRPIRRSTPRFTCTPGAAAIS
jgi:hypothetical protein